MLVSTLAVSLVKAELCSTPVALSWAWRILNEYPDNLRKFAIRWAESKDAPSEKAILKIGEFSLAAAMDLSGASVPAALEMLYVLSKDNDAGKDILFRCNPHDRRD